MTIKFKPMPWLTLLTLICLGILITLGTWQYHRLQWKTNLLVEIDQAASASPLLKASEIADLHEAGRPIDFRRVELVGRFLQTDINGGDPFHLMMSNGKSMLWHFVQPFQTRDGLIFVVTGGFSHSLKLTPPRAEQGDQTVVGYVRLVRDSSMQPKSLPQNNEWYEFNAEPDTLDWETIVPGERISSAYYVENFKGADTAQDLAVKKPDLPNNHFEYMLTWYSFALILLVIYFLLHHKQGRLQFGNKNA